MKNNVDEILDEILGDYEKIAKRAVRSAARRGQQDIIKEAKKYLKEYYRYKPKMYKRTRSLKHAIVPIFEDKSTNDRILIEFGIKYDASMLEGRYKSNSRYHQSGDKWISRNDPSFNWSKDEKGVPIGNNGLPEPEWILDNFLRGEHGGAQRDFNATYTLMPRFMDNELPERIEGYIKDSLFESVVNQLSKL